MPPKSFSVRVDQDDLARLDLTAGLARSAPDNPGDGLPGPALGVDPAHHGARDGRQAARGRSERDHARSGGGKSRSYAFRRS
ncbi:hypothetical protein GCM10010172_48530 [Paractinoplanes ferrugineus]|uniref:Uncharacterized protein n=1 Tax=Paractinoplanes ferrugineus TaxID=113564 RepID=A0A919IZT4_9ACTN|nr:hypothetical protein [Actinoplanes ferrugineus]GIE11114.1 hypothetical protein Afe05nite_29540 [Actinoplanes ferrugineus]